MENETQKSSLDVFCIIGIILGSISCIGLVSTISRIMYNKNYYSGHLFSILVMLLISDLFSNFSFMSYFIFNQKYCEVQTIFMVFSDTSMLLWNLILVLKTFQFFSFRENMKKRGWFICILVGYFFPAFIALSGSLFEIYGSSSKWCYIIDPVIGFLFSIIQLLIYGFNIFITIFAKRFYYENIHENEDVSRYSKYYSILRFSYVHIFAFIFGVINRFIILLGSFSAILDIIVIIIYNSIGILNFLVFHCSFKEIDEEEPSLFETLN